MRRLAFLALGFAGAMLALTGVLWAYAGHFCVAAGAAFAGAGRNAEAFGEVRGDGAGKA